uniref:G-protein coupled receptors family 2 profile 1 domain-containing protein n=1 Tax=Stomoxys calcitrans TaxID=35570 RepID=A0A1I8PY96_STOCA
MMFTNQYSMNRLSNSSYSLISATASSLQATMESLTNAGDNIGGAAEATDGDEEVTDVAPPDPIEKLRAECWERLNQSTTHNEPGTYCPGTFDGWLCWPDTPAGKSAYERCPDFITGFDPLRYAHKECELNGEWFKHPLTNKSWSNYTTCVN